jgi:hypothetical protein
LLESVKGLREEPAATTSAGHARIGRAFEKEGDASSNKFEIRLEKDQLDEAQRLILTPPPQSLRMELL